MAVKNHNVIVDPDDILSGDEVVELLNALGYAAVGPFAKLGVPFVFTGLGIILGYLSEKLKSVSGISFVVSSFNCGVLC